MPKQSAGLLMYRRIGAKIEVLLVHPGGPFWQRKDLGAWSIPKGEIAGGEDALQGAVREFQEETSVVPTGPFHPLTAVRQKSGKIVQAWYFQGDCEASACKSNTFTMQWPPSSGKLVEFPEVDRAEFFDLETAGKKILPAQAPLLAALHADLEAHGNQ